MSRNPEATKNDNVILSPKRFLNPTSSETDFSGADCDRKIESENFSLGVLTCYRCSQPVYPMEKIEPQAGQRYHPQCFRCAVCQTKLTLATFCRSLHSSRDSQIYCKRHQPRQDKVMLCKFSTRRSTFPAFKLSWQQSSSSSSPETSSGETSPYGTTSGRNT